MIKKDSVSLYSSGVASSELPGGAEIETAPGRSRQIYPTAFRSLQIIASHIASALVNAHQAMRLHALHLANIERYEGERLSLAGDLHDEVLNELAALSMNVDRVTSPKFEDQFHRLTNRIREMISGLRPVMLNYGLHAALQELVDEITRRTRDGVSLNLELTSSQIRYASKVEGHLYRIVQQATENALRHSGGKTIRIYGELEPATACVNVEDDGIGFADHATLDFEHFLAQRHFGVARMFERAAIIGADLSIDAKPGQGTKVRVIWRP